MSKNLAKGLPKPPLQNQSANPEDWLIRDKEGSFIDKDKDKDGPYMKIIQVYLILLCNIFRLYLFMVPFSLLFPQ